MTKPNVLPEVCSDCPFRRKSAPGWLGELMYQPRAFLAPYWHGAQRNPCHKAINFRRDDWEAQAATAPLCRGMLIFAANNCKRLDNPEAAAALAEVSEDRDAIFSWEQEFYDHHERKIKG